jgi:hypothetical protein
MVAPLFTHHFGDTSYNLYTIFYIGLQEKQNGKVVVLIVNTTTSEEKSSLPAYAF